MLWVDPLSAPNPLAVGLSGSDRIVLHAQHFPHLVQQLELGIGNHQLPTLAWPDPREHYPFAVPAGLHAPSLAPRAGHWQAIPRFPANTLLGRNLSV